MIKYNKQFKKIIKEKSDLTDKKFDLMFEIMDLESQIEGMKKMHTGKNGYSYHQADALIFNTQIELDSLIEKLDLEDIDENAQ